jgi:gentisate 1,2-dioxygenase
MIDGLDVPFVQALNQISFDPYKGRLPVKPNPTATQAPASHAFRGSGITLINRNPFHWQKSVLSEVPSPLL